MTFTSKKLVRELETVQAGCTVRTITVNDIRNCCDIIKRRFSAVGVHLRDLTGVKFYVGLHNETFPRAYKYIPYGTTFELTYTGKRWDITNIWRENCNRGHNVYYTINGKQFAFDV